VTTEAALILAAVGVTAAGSIAADLKSRLTLARVLRLTAMAGIILLAATSALHISKTYRLLIIAGLGASFIGDIFMTAPKKRFTAGLLAFLVAHICYSAAFLRIVSIRVEVMIALPFLVYALFVMRTLFPHLGSAKGPVALYIVVMTGMAILAAQWYINAGGTSPLFALGGAVLFTASDTILAFNRFFKKIPRAQLYILGTYFPAQVLLALSV
jgi:uncharacterized membrane protein YhhN